MSQRTAKVLYFYRANGNSLRAGNAAARLQERETSYSTGKAQVDKFKGARQPLCKMRIQSAATSVPWRVPHVNEQR